MDANLESNLKKALKHFSLKEIYEYALNEISDITWEAVTKDISDSKKRTSQSEVINIIVRLLTQLELTPEEINAITENLELLAVAISTKKTWITYKLLNHTTRIPVTSHEIFKKIRETFRRNNIQIKLNVIDYNSNYAISIAKRTSPKKKSVNPHYFKPIYIIFDSKTQYFFSNRILSNDIFNISFANSLGYKDFKQCKLTGRNIPDLLKLLRYKEKNKERIEFDAPEFVPKVKISESTIDYTQKQERVNYVDKLYGEPPPELQTLTFRIENEPWRADLMRGETFSAELQFSSPNVMNMIKDAVADNFIEHPVPEYIQNVLKHGKNDFRARNENAM